ncbi:MAG: hypothetical protein QME42_11110 [bacterium]|nr:hypothetical protein [bacterium]
MCGIAGILNVGKEPINPWIIKDMCDVVAHRGPDDAGYALFSFDGISKGKNLWFELTDNFVKNKIEKHTSGKINHRLFIWSLLSFEWWLRRFLGG